MNATALAVVLAPPEPSWTTKAKNTIWVRGMTKTVPSTKSIRMNPRLVRGAKTAFVQNVRQNDVFGTIAALTDVRPTVQ